MSLIRSKSLPGVGAWSNEESSSTDREERGRDSGVLIGSDQPSFGSEPRSSLLCELASGVALSEPPSGEIDEKVDNRQDGIEPDGEIKKATIGRHYYPEGGWGWVVLTMALLVQISAHGIHQATGVLLIEIVNTYKESFLTTSK